MKNTAIDKATKRADISRIELAAYRHAKKKPRSKTYGRRYLYHTPAGMLMVEWTGKDWRGIWLPDAEHMWEYTDGSYRVEP